MRFRRIPVPFDILRRSQIELLLTGPPVSPSNCGKPLAPYDSTSNSCGHRQNRTASAVSVDPNAAAVAHGEPCTRSGFRQLRRRCGKRFIRSRSGRHPSRRRALPAGGPTQPQVGGWLVVSGLSPIRSQHLSTGNCRPVPLY